MKHIGYLLAFLAVQPSLAFAAEIAEFGCQVMVTENGEKKSIDAPDLRILDYSGDNQLLRFKSNGTRKLTAVFCRRSSAVPAAYDYQVILAGAPFYIEAGQRLAVLELLDNAYRLRLVAGPPLTEQELAEVSARLKSFPLDRALQEPTPRKPFKRRQLPGL
jgi:hypothetical protein